MSWITLTNADVLARMATDELDAIEDAGETSDQDRLGAIIQQVTQMVRGKVAACAENLPKLGPSGTIPDELLWAAATIARDSLVGSLPVSESDTEDRTTELRKAHEMLDQAQRCEFRIADDSGSIAETSNGGAGRYGGESIVEF